MVGSCFGIFFSGEDTGTGQTMQTVVREINEDYENQLDTIKANISYDVLEMSGSRAVWPEVLSVYAVKTTTDPDNAMDVATVDDSRKAILKDIFWQMNEITSRTETNTETVIEESDDGNGNIVETTTTVTRTTLYITVSHKTAEEMADQFDFDADQREQLAELLADETIPCGRRCCTESGSVTMRLWPWHCRRWVTSADSRIGHGTALRAVWNGVPAL